MLVLDNIKDGGIRLRSVLQLVLHKEDITSYKKEISCKIIEFSKASNTTQNTLKVLPLHGNSGCTKAPHCCVIITVSVLYIKTLQEI